MKTPFSGLPARVAGLALLASPLLSAVQYGPEPFLFDDGVTDLGDGTVIGSSDGVASVQGGVLRLTEEGTADTHAAFRIPALAGSSEGWTATFEFVLSDQPDGALPGEGFSFNYGSIPALNGNQQDPAAADAYGSGEEGWHPSVEHLGFEIDVHGGAGDEAGFAISHNGTDLIAADQVVAVDGDLVQGIVWMAWHPDDGASMSVDLGDGLVPVFTNVATPDFTGDDDYSFAISARTGAVDEELTVDNVKITTIPPGFVVLPGPIISEFMADNADTIEDEDCRSSDWIELFNATAAPTNLQGWYLTDDPLEPLKWEIPDLPLEANARKLIFASGKDQTLGELHTDFALDKDGEYLALVRPNGTVASSYAYGPQVEDISYGSLGQGQTQGFFSTPTPGEPNVEPQGDLVLDKPLFSEESQVIADTLFVELSLPDTSPDGTIRYTTDGSTPTATSREYSDPIAVRLSTRISARIFEPGKEPGPVRDRTFIKLDQDILNFSSDIPIIIVDSFGYHIDGEAAADSAFPFRPVHAIFIDRDPETGRARVTDIPDFEGRGGMRVRGQTSSGFPKKQYAFEAWDSEGNDKDVSIFGMPSESDWVIHAPYSDKTLMRNKIVYDTSFEMGYPAPRTQFAELFFNGYTRNNTGISIDDYRGVYVFMEKIKANEDRVDLKDLETCDTDAPAITGGYMFKKDKGSPPGNVVFSTSREGHRMEIIEPDPPTSDQRAWIDEWMDTFETILHSDGRFADPNRGYRNYIDVQSFIDTHIWVELYKNIDGFRLSSYFHKDRGRKLVASPVWDYNLSLGNANYLQGEVPTGWYWPQLSANQYPWYRRLFLDPEFELQYWDRWFELREGIFKTENILGRIDDYFFEIRRPAVRNFGEWTSLLGNYTWPNAGGYQNRQTHQAEVEWMKDWLEDRLTWYDAQFDNPPVFDPPGGFVDGSTTLSIANPNRGGDIYYTTDGSDPREAYANTPSATAQLYSGAIPLDASMTIRARIVKDDVWSPIETESYLLDGEFGAAHNLAISKIHYRPSSDSTTEFNRGFDRRTDFEFVEIMNTGSAAVDLSGMEFIGGIRFDFDLSEVPFLAPGERAVVVSNRDAFAIRYSQQLADLRIAGEFTNNLSNDGETITLLAADGSAIQNFFFNDASPWPEMADGDGPSLVLINPLAQPDHADASNWRSSTSLSGSPGQYDGAEFAGDPDGDEDGDGMNDFLQYALAPPSVEPVLPTLGVAEFTVEDVTGDYLTMSYSRNTAANDVLVSVQLSENLIDWSPAWPDGMVLLSRTEHPDGTETLTYRSKMPVSEHPERFVRLSVVGTP